MVETPVLIATFARPEYARQTFDVIKKAKPKKLYFYSNKARNNKPDEVLRNNQVRELIKEVNWECDLKTFFRDEYVDVYTSLWGAYNWIFEQEEEAIILEEDCVASLAFFDYCDQLLPKYKFDKRVWVISGNNFIEGYNPSGYDYIFSPFAFQYGWASWRTRWKALHHDGFPVNEIIKSDLYRQIYGNAKAARHAYKQLQKLQDRNGIYKPVSWDYVFQMTMRCNGGFGIVPIKNLVSNIGIEGENNSAFNKKVHHKKILDSSKYEINKNPLFVVSDYRFTNMFFKKITNRKKSFIKRVLKYLIRKISE